MVIGLSSNVRLQVAETIDQHPYVSFIRGDICQNNRPLPVALATDDAGLFDTDLSLEFCLAAANSDLTWNEMKRIAKQSLQASFASGDEKAQLISQWERDIQQFESSWAPPKSTSDLPTGCPDPT
jgi:adenosine deaminase